MLDKDLNGIIYKNRIQALDDYADHSEMFEYLGIEDDDNIVRFRQNWWNNSGEWDGTIEICGPSSKVEKFTPDIISYFVSLNYKPDITKTIERENVSQTTVRL